MDVFYNATRIDRQKLTHFAKAILVLLLSLTCSFAAAQNVKLDGRVTNQNGDPVIGATVKVEGANIATATDIQGSFTLNLPKGSTIYISSVGYEPRTVTVSNQTFLDITLNEEAQQMGEVVVVGFGTQKKVNLTGAVGVASAKDLEERPVMLATQALQGLVPGLNITQTNGMLESRASINIRGTGTIGDGSSGSPLILIDGMEGDINAINPQDIDNVSVLKDAAASSIYGARAPFGVILITTKKGSKDKTVINYNNSFRWNKPMNMPKMMDSYSFALYFNDAAINGGGSAHFGNEQIERILAYQRGEITTGTIAVASTGRWEEGFDGGGNANTNFYKEVFRSKALSQEHNFSISGGNNKVTYYTSFNLLAQDGLMRYNQDYYDRYAATAKIGYEATDWLKINYSNRFVREKYKRPSALTNDMMGDLARQGWPVLPIYDPNGNMLSRITLGLRDQGNDTSETDNHYQQIQAVFEPVKNWKTFVEYNYSILNADRHWDKKVTYMHDVEGNPYVWSDSSNVHEEHKKENRTNFNVYSEYSFSLHNSHNFKVMAGVQSDKMKQKYFDVQRNGIIVDSNTSLNGTNGKDIDGNEITPSITGYTNRWTTLGWFGRINYDYEGRYLFEANFRYDGASRFRSDDRWVFSPSFSAGWNISQEKFFEPLRTTVDQLKIRGSYGQLANQNTSGWYPTYAEMTISSTSNLIVDGKQQGQATAPTTLVPTSIGWEKIRTTNIGLETSLFQYRLQATFDYFIRKTKDMVGPAQEMPGVLGVGVPKTNNTDLTDKGFELTISWNDRLKNGLGYGVRFLLSDYRTKIDKYPNSTKNLDTYIAGRYINEIWGYETKGIAKTQAEMDAHLATTSQSSIGTNWSAGDIMYVDRDNNNTVSNGSNTLDDPGDLKVIGNSTPRYQFGFEVTADWKGFDLRAFFQGVMKRDYWQDSYYFWGAHSSGMWWSTGFKEHKDYFRDATTTSVSSGALGENLNSYYPRPLFGNSKNQQKQSKYVQDASYIRLKNIQIGYTIPQKFTQRFHIQKIRVYVSGENLWTSTNVKGMFDPETIGGGWGGNVYPLSKVYSFGLSVNF